MFSLTAPTRPCWLMLVLFFNWGPALSASPIALTPTLTLTAPNGGQTLTPTDSTTLTWTSSGLSGNVRIELSRDAGATWELLADSVGNTGSWFWRIAGAGTSQGLIRVSSLSEPGLADTSDAAFTIKQSQLTLLTPNGGQSFRQGDGINISWSGANFYGGVKVELSRDNGLNWELLSSGNPISSSTVWTVQGAPTSQGRVRVTALRSSEISDTSDLPFSLLESTLVLTSPNGGQSYTPGDGLILTWVGANFVGGVNVDLSRDLGGSWERILSGAAVSATTSWVIRGVGTTQAMIRVSSVRNPSLFDVSDGPFTIKQSQLALTSPNGGELLTPGDITTFTWAGANFLGGFNLELSRDNGTSWEMLSTLYTTSGSYSWRVQGQGTTVALARITPLRLPELVDSSDANFTIKQPSLTLSTPNEGQSFTPGDGMLVSWSGSNFVGGVNLELSRDSGTTWETLLTGAPNSGSYSWRVRGQGTTTALVRVTSARLPEISDRSDALFTIKQVSLTLLSPNGGERILKGTTQNITWSVANLIGTIQVELSRDNGSSWETLTSSAANAGPYAWVVSQAVTSEALLRIRSTRLPELSDSSNAVFLISSDTLQLTRPSGIYLQAGTTDLISWTTNLPGPFKLEFSGNGGQSWSTLTNSTSVTSYSWVVDATLTTQGFIRVSPVDNPLLSSTNPLPFTITAPGIGLTQSAYPPSYVPGATVQFNWTSASPGPFDLAYSGDGGGSWTTLTTNYTSKSYAWTVDSVPTTQGHFRVRLTDYPTSSSTNRVPFIILDPVLTLTSPNGSSNYTVGRTMEIAWSTNVPQPFMIEFSADEGATWTTIAASVSTTIYNWVVSNTPTTQGFIRVSPLSSPNYRVTNEVPFSILEPHLTLTAPNGGESFTPGDGMRLTWSGSNFTDGVNVELTRDDGVSWERLISNAPNSSNTSLRVSGQGTTTGRIRVSSVRHPEIFDVSDPVFTIKQAQLNLISPNGGETYNPGTPVVVSWSVANLIGGVDLAVSLDGGSTWSNLSTLNFGSSYVWTATQSTTQALFRVSANRIASLFDISDGPFTILPQTITLNQPTGTSAYFAGSTELLSWTTNSPGPFKLEFSGNGGQSWSTLTNSASGTSYSWVVDATLTTQGFIRVSPVDNPQLSSTNPSPFTIIAPPVSLDQPGHTPSYFPGATAQFSWSSPSPGPFDLEYSGDGGGSWTTLATSYTSKSYTWTVDATPTTQGFFRVSLTNYPSSSSTNSAPFTILEPALTLTNPSGSSNYTADSTVEIAWSTNVPGPFMLEFSADGAATWSTIATSCPSTVCNWVVAYTPTTQGFIRVSSLSFPDYHVTNEAPFRILQPQLTLASPNGGESFTPGDDMDLIWSGSGFLDGVNVELTRDDGVSWEPLLDNVASSSSTSVPISGQATTAGRIRVSSVRHPEVFDVSDPVFTINQSQLNLISPNGGETYNLDTPIAVSWSVANLIGGVDLAVSLDGGSTWSNLSTLNLGSNYAWTATQSTTQALFRVSANRIASLFDLSDGPFTVVESSVTLTSPIHGESFDTGSNMNLSHSSANYSGNFDYHVSWDQGITWLPIATTSATSTVWRVTGPPATPGLIRVSLASAPTIFDIGDLPISIEPYSASFVSPSGGEVYHYGEVVPIQLARSHYQDDIKVQLSLNNGSSWQNLLDVGNGDTALWNVTQSPSTTVLLRLTNADASEVFDTLETPLTIRRLITITRPSAGQSFGIGSWVWIEWLQDYIGTAVVEVSNDGRVSWTTLTTTYNRYFSWTVPGPTTNNIWIRVKSSQNPNFFDEVGPLSFFECPSFGTLGNISNPVAACAEIPVPYSVPELHAGVYYAWAVSDYGGYVASGQGTPNVSVIWYHGATLRVTASDQCGNQATKSKSINVGAGFLGSDWVRPGDRVTYSPYAGSGTWAVSCQNCTFSEQGRELIVDWGAPETASISFTQGSCTNQQPIRVFHFLAPDFSAVGTGDFDNNGLDDVLWHQPDTGESRAWLALPEGDYKVIAMPTRPEGLWRYLGMMRTTETGPKAMLWTDELGNYELMSQESTETWSQTSIPLRVDGWPMGLADVDGDGQGELLTIKPDGANWVNVLQGSEVLDRFPLETEVVPDSEIDLLIRSAGRTRPIDETKGWWYLGSFATDEEVPQSALYYNLMLRELGQNQAEDTTIAPLLIRGQAEGSDLSTIFDPESTIQLERNQTKESPK